MLIHVHFSNVNQTEDIALDMVFKVRDNLFHKIVQVKDALVIHTTTITVADKFSNTCNCGEWGIFLWEFKVLLKIRKPYQY